MIEKTHTYCDIMYPIKVFYRSINHRSGLCCQSCRHVVILPFSICTSIFFLQFIPTILQYSLVCSILGRCRYFVRRVGVLGCTCETQKFCKRCRGWAGINDPGGGGGWSLILFQLQLIYFSCKSESIIHKSVLSPSVLNCHNLLLAVIGLRKLWEATSA